MLQVLVPVEITVAKNEGCQLVFPELSDQISDDVFRVEGSDGKLHSAVKVRSENGDQC